MSVSLRVGGGEGVRDVGSEQEGARTDGDPGQPERGRGVGNTGRGAGPAALGKGASGRPARRGRGRPHTRHCLDAAIIVSSEHPGSAGSAERELNKEPREEESREKSARGAGSSPVGLFLCPAYPALCSIDVKASSEMPDGDPAPPGPRRPGQSHCVGFGEGEKGVLAGKCILHLSFFIWRAVGTESQIPAGLRI